MAFACNSCTKTFTARYLLNRHQVTHTRVRNHLCPVCGEAFLQSSALNRHAAGHEARLGYRCEECGKRFNRSSTRDVHQASHAEKKHICKRCGKTFHQKSTLKTHELIHTETRPFQCWYCEKTFRQRSNLQVHISRWHRGVPEILRNDDSSFSRKKEDVVVCSLKLRQDLRRENCTNGHKQTKRKYCKETYPFDIEMSQMRDADIVGKNNQGSCPNVKRDLNNGNCEAEAKISDLVRNRAFPASNKSLQTLENSRKDCRNSITVATENKLCSDSDVEDDEIETEECSSLVHFTTHVQEAARFKSDNSEVCLNVEEESGSEHPSRSAPLSIQCCKDIYERSVAFPDSESSQPRDDGTRPSENSAVAQKVATGISATSGNQSKAEEATSKTATAMVVNDSVPVWTCPMPIRPLASAVDTILVEATERASDTGKIPPISDALLPQSNINIHRNCSPVHTNHSPVHTNHSPINTNHSSANDLVSKQNEQPSNVLPNVENFLANVFKSCRLATSLISPLVTIEESTTIPPNQKVAPTYRSGNFSGSKTPVKKPLRVKGSTSRKSEKVMYVKLFTPEKPVTEFIWGCGLK